MTLPTSTTISALAEPAAVDKLVAELKSALAKIEKAQSSLRRSCSSGATSPQVCRASRHAVRFGDHSSLGRLVDIATDVGGRLAAVIAAHAAALRDRDAAAILAAAHQLEVIGALFGSGRLRFQRGRRFYSHSRRPRPAHSPRPSCC